MKPIGIFSLEADLHAHAICHELKLFGAQCHFFATDAQIEDGGAVWEISKSPRSILIDYDGANVDVSELSTIWWRRVNQPQKAPEKFPNPQSFEFVCNEWKSTIFGMVNDSFRGVWVNDPKYDALAGNKIYQLTIAKSVGLRVPDTIVTNRYGHLKRFFEKHNSNVVAKKLQGAASLSLATLQIGDKELATAKAHVSMCPAMYQERIISGKHVRANCFGDKVYSVLIESPDLDWRRNLNCKFSQYKLGDDINLKLVNLLSELNLKMGIMDLMITDDEIVWLEINPQGQFLFAEGLSGLNLKRSFAEYLLKLSEAGSVNNSNQHIINSRSEVAFYIDGNKTI